jgi:dethiobiotin synthetase
MSRGFFITGTDTGVGKTVVSGAVIRAVHMTGLKACGMKPIETGCTRRGSSHLPSDGTFLKDVSNMDEHINFVAPYCLESPLAPMSAAEIEGVSIDVNDIMEKFSVLAERYDAVVVEGVGGLLVPITSEFFVADLAKLMGLPLIVVAVPFLGTINHTLLTVDYALNAGLKVAGIIISSTRPGKGGLAEKTGPMALRRLAPVPVIGEIPFLEDMGDADLDRAVAKHLNMAVIREHLGLLGD